MAETYPKRNSHFAHRFTRLVMKSCAALDIGHQACLLLVYIAHTEDAARYSGAVRFWNEQLSAVLGFRSPKQLTQARERAVASGWLHYHRNGTREVGQYWVQVPAQFQHLSDDLIEPTASGFIPNTERIAEREDGSFIPNTEREAEPKRNAKRSQSGKPSNPIPDPKPITSDSKSDTSVWFDRFWNAYSKKTGRKKAEAAFMRAVKADAKARKVTPTEAAEHITQIASTYSAGFKDDRTYQLHPTTWLNGEHWNDDPEVWPSATDRTSDADYDWPHVLQSVRDKYHPDLKNAADVEAALTAEQFAAAKSVGLSRIANADRFDKETPAAYRAARKATA